MASALPAGPTPVRDMFEALVPGYDRFNNLSSLGLHSHWRRKATQMFDRGAAVLDVGTGTGDLAQTLLQRGCVVTGVDFSAGMIQSAREKLSLYPNVSLYVAPAQQLPFQAETFDGIASAFVIRNLHHEGLLTESFREFQRVLKLPSRMVHLELTRPQNRLMAWGHDWYLRLALPFFGRLSFGKDWPQDYLAATIKKFLSPKEICGVMTEAGFKSVSVSPLAGGIAHLFMGEKC